MEVIRTVAAMRAVRTAWQNGQKTAGFVPTMGYLHAGHISLVRRARRENDQVIVSIYVNPTQFGPHEDFTRYPRDLPRDLAMLEVEQVDYVFAPEHNEEMYPIGSATYVVLEGPIVERLEGVSRPGHFRGVATVVTKLFEIVRPTIAYFGQKDAQQAAVIQRMTSDLFLDIQIQVAPIIREPDGLAMSSRNVYLQGDDRAAATVLYRALQAARAMIDDGERNGDKIREAMRRVILAEPRAHLDYVSVCDPATMVELDEVRPPALLPLAVRIGPARLIDNFLWRADGSWEVGRQADEV
jgi:pantoate--beta-alanine ligase